MSRTDFSGLDKKIKNNAFARNLYLFLIELYKKQNMVDGKPMSCFLCFDLFDLVNEGIYDNLLNAKNNFLEDMKTLTCLQIKDKNTIRTLFTGCDVEYEKYCTVYLNQHIDVLKVINHKIKE